MSHSRQPEGVAGGTAPAIEFLREVFRNCEGYVEFRELGGKTRQHFESLPLSELPPIDPENSDVYFGVAPRCERDGRAKSVRETGALWADVDSKVFDGGKEDAQRRLAELGPLVPSAIVDSGHGYHVYWLLESPAPIERALPLMKRLADRISPALDNVSDAPRILRVPYTLNHKGEAVLPVTVVHLDPSHRFSLDSLEQQLGTEEPRSPEVVQHVAMRGGSEPPSSGSVLRGIPEGMRNVVLFRHLCRLRSRGAELRDAIGHVSEMARHCRPPYPVDSNERNGQDETAEPVEEMARRVWETYPGPTATRFLDCAFNRTDYGNAERLVARHGHDLRFCHPWGRWLVWDGTRWRDDDSGEAERGAKETLRAIYMEASLTEEDDSRKQLARWGLQSESERHIRAMVKLARSEPGIAVSPSELDLDPWLLNVANGTLDLRTGDLRPHDRTSLITKLLPIEYSPDAKAPTWLAFLKRIMDGNEELISFLQRAVGYSLTGDISERVLFLLHGCGANGKSTFLEAIRALVGDYGLRTPTETLLTKRSDGIPNDVARLRGARFVTATECDENRRFAEARIKDLTGGDTVTARFLRAEYFDFRPQCKIWLATNHKPVVRGTDKAIWDRLRLVPFDVTIPPAEQDRALLAKLAQELGGILTWAVSGCIAWREQGLGVPPEVVQATERYRQEMDVLGCFIADCCELLPEYEVTSRELYGRYSSWCGVNGERALTKIEFGRRLHERGFEQSKPQGQRGWRGIRMTGVTDTDAPFPFK